MPVTVRISDAELRQRLEEHDYNVPPITDTTRAILIKKLNQLDQQNSTNLRKQGGYTGLDYSSAEDEDFAPSLATSWRSGRMSAPEDTGGNLAGGVGTKRRPSERREEENTGAITSRVTRSSRNNSREGTPQNGYTKTVSHSRRNISLMTHSETEENSEGDEDEEEDNEDEDDEEGEEEDDENGVDNVDFGIQTSFSNSSAPAKFRGQKLVSSSYSSTSHNTSQLNAHTFPITSPYLRKNINKHGSLNEALSTLPSSKPPVTSPEPPSPQASPRPHSSSNSQSYSQDYRGPFSYMVVSSLIIAVAVTFFLFLLWQYLSLVPPESQSRPSMQVCAGIAGELPNTDCVPSYQFNQTVQLYKLVVKLLHSTRDCMEKQESMERSQILAELANTSGFEEKYLKNNFDYLLVLLRQNQSWGIKLEESTEGTSLRLVMTPTWTCTIYMGIGRVVRSMKNAVWMIISVLMFLVTLMGLVRIKQWTQARTKKREEEVFSLVRQVTNFLYQHHQGVAREGKSGHSYLAISHIRDQLIPPQDREAKSGVWADVIDYIQRNESRIRHDVQQIFGKDFRVWQWLPDISWSPGSSPPQGPSSPSTPTSSTSPPTTAHPWPHVPTTQGLVGWQGCAFSLGKHVATPFSPPTSCLKVRHVFDVSHQEGAGWVTQVKEEILRRCRDANIVHLAVDSASEDGVLYIKTAGMEEAGKVFRSLHGQWYRGQLVTVKYLRLQRYHERFPDAKHSCTPLKYNK